MANDELKTAAALSGASVAVIVLVSAGEEDTNGDENAAPTAASSWSPDSPRVGDEVVFDGTGSSDPDGSIEDYVWDVAGVTKNGDVVTHTFGSDGDHTIALTVTDNDGATDTDERTISIDPEPNESPVARFSFTPSSPAEGEAVEFDASASSDPDGSIESYDWTIGGQSLSGSVVNRTFTDSGTHSAVLVVTDDRGESDQVQKDVTVTRTAPEPDGTYIWFRSANPPEQASFSFSVSDAVALQEGDFGGTHEYTVNESYTEASGNVSGGSDLPGFWYDGDLETFDYDGPLEVYISNVQRDPDRLPDDTSPVDDGPNGPSNPDQWNLVLDDQFEGNSLDTSTWGIGFGWGVNANYAKSTSHASAVSVEDGRLVCELQNVNGQLRHGAIHSKNKAFFEPPVVFETRMRAHSLPGCNQAFWTKSNTECWPPEIDVVEVPTKRMYNSMHTVHWHRHGNCPPSGSGVNPDNDMKQGSTYGAGPDRHEAFYTYTTRWLPGQITHWVDGNHVQSFNVSGNARSSFNAGGAHYMMLNNVMGRDGGWMTRGTPRARNAPEDPAEMSQYKLTTEFEYAKVWTQ